MQAGLFLGLLVGCENRVPFGEVRDPVFYQQIKHSIPRKLERRQAVAGRCLMCYCPPIAVWLPAPKMLRFRLGRTRRGRSGTSEATGKPSGIVSRIPASRATDISRMHAQGAA
jgi:hypothetical protein